MRWHNKGLDPPKAVTRLILPLSITPIRQSYTMIGHYENHVFISHLLCNCFLL